MFSVSVCRGQNDRIERNDIVTKDKSVSSSDERLQRYLGSRYGQRSETRDRYAEAIQACGQIGYIDMTITEIARMFGHNPECLRSQLKLHFPEIMQMRDRIRVALGLSKQRKPGMSDKTMAKYAPAVELLRTTTLTIREVAERCGVGALSLQKFVMFYHRDLAEQRLALRVNALDRRKAFGGISGTGRPIKPRKATEELYAEALELYRTTDRTVTDIALECGVDPHNFHCYLQRWCRGDMAVREKHRREMVEKKRLEQAAKEDCSRTAVATRKYSPALKMIEEGATYETAAEQLGVDAYNLSRWVLKNHPEIHRLEHQHQIVCLPEGTTCTKDSWTMFREAVEAYCQTDEPLNQIATRFNLRPTSLGNFLRRKFPQAVARRKEREASGACNGGDAIA